MSALIALLLAGFIASANAHGYVNGITADGIYYQGWSVIDSYNKTPPARVGWSEQGLDSGFVSPASYASPDIICHKSATNAKLSAKVAAGGTVVMHWAAWADGHSGPVLNYMAPCGSDCTTVDKTSLKFFKIDAQGLLSGTTSKGKFATDLLIPQNKSWTVTIPSKLKAGKYVLRHELIALHGAGSTNGAQNYPQCVNLEVSGDGTVVPSGVPATTFYKANDPGILINIYQAQATTYAIPGPPVATF